MRILAIDPSSSSTGVAIFEDKTPIECFTIKPKGDTLIERMFIIIEQIISLLKSEKYDYVAIETPYLGFNRSTAMKMGQIFGIISIAILLAKYKSEQIIQIHPMTAKKAVGMKKIKNRKEGKEFVKTAMEIRFPHLEILDDDMSDALAIGIAALDKIKENNE